MNHFSGSNASTDRTMIILKPLLLVILLGIIPALRAAEADFTIHIYHGDNPRLANTPKAKEWIQHTPVFSQRVSLEIGKKISTEFKTTSPAAVTLKLDCEALPNGAITASRTGYALMGTISYQGSYQGQKFGAGPVSLMADGGSRYEALAATAITTGGWWIFETGHAFLCVVEVNRSKP
ncbi:MAG TPA: hypothetical protein VK968_05790 [Roseimicrobium sp.]|nr:hypothetical protein [Roseimicrobium sp.]